MALLPAEDEDEISVGERRVRRCLAALYRMVIAVFMASHVFDFLFNSVWMHGYIWSLNQRVEIDLSDKSAGVIVEHQLSKVGEKERLAYALLFSASLYLFLLFADFTCNKTVWNLLKLSLRYGVLIAFVRTTQMQQRLYPALHEGFYGYLGVFCVAFVLCIRPLERVQKGDEKKNNNAPPPPLDSASDASELEKEKVPEDFELIEREEAVQEKPKAE